MIEREHYKATESGEEVPTFFINEKKVSQESSNWKMFKQRWYYVLLWLIPTSLFTLWVKNNVMEIDSKIFLYFMAIIFYVLLSGLFIFGKNPD